MTGLWQLGASAIAERVRKRSLSATEVVRAHIDRISATEPRVDAFLQLLPERALDAARRVDEAKDLGLERIFCLTYKPAFFKKQGFKLVDKFELPRKVWAECYSCPKFPDCDEVALVYTLKKGK